MLKSLRSLAKTNGRKFCTVPLSFVPVFFFSAVFFCQPWLAPKAKILLLPTCLSGNTW